MADNTDTVEKKLTGAALKAAERKAARLAAEAAASVNPAPGKGAGSSEEKETMSGTSEGQNPDPAAAGNGADPAATGGGTPEDQTGDGTDPDASIGPEDLFDAEKTEEPDEFEALAAEYGKLYPRNKTFYITSDKQVFLQSGREDAKRHQCKLGGDFKTITIE